MKTSVIAWLLFFGLQILNGQEAPSWAIVIHGGAGNINARHIPPEMADALSDQLNESLDGSTLKAGTSRFASGNGAEVVDSHGNLAAGTSTGGMTNQRVDKQGNIAMEFNTSGMLRAFAVAGGKKGVMVFEEQ
jgi:isoaspartyl peptidase/L-asparaginase-like protein (Ntn-hydrolase superfamily)